MAMDHKAFAFDWSRFQCDLYPLLVDALVTGGADDLEAFVDQHLAELTDPYEGQVLDEYWRRTLENGDVHEIGDYALTRYYNPTDSRGIGYAWTEVSDGMPEPFANALLGFPIGTAEQWFDPGRCGSYFQTPVGVSESLAILKTVEAPELASYVELLEKCMNAGQGVYVTF